MKRPLVLALLIATSCVALGLLAMMGTFVSRTHVTAGKPMPPGMGPEGVRQAEQGITAPVTIELNVKADGSILFDGKEATRAELAQRLGNPPAAGKQQPVRVRGEAGVNYQVIADIIDLCRKPGP